MNSLCRAPFPRDTQQNGLAASSAKAILMKLLVVLVVLLLGQGWALPPVPGIEGHITSRGKQLSASQKSNLDELLGKIQEESKVDLAVLVMEHELDSGTLDAMASQTFHAWSIGKSWDGGGALVVLSKDGREIAVQQSGEQQPFREKHLKLLKDTILSAASEGKTYEGLRLGIERAGRILRSGGKTYLSAPPQQRDIPRSKRYSLGVIIVLALAIFSSRAVER